MFTAKHLKEFMLADAGTHFKIEGSHPEKFVTRYPTGEYYLVCTRAYDGRKVFNPFAITMADAFRITDSGFPFVDYENLSDYEQRDILHRLLYHESLTLRSSTVDELLK